MVLCVSDAANAEGEKCAMKFLRQSPPRGLAPQFADWDNGRLARWRKRITVADPRWVNKEFVL